MFSFIKSIFNYFYKIDDEHEDLTKEDFLAEQLVGLEATWEQYYENDQTEMVPRDAKCFQRTGIITYLEKYQYVLIDGMLYFDISTCSVPINVNDKVLYLAYCDSNDVTVVVRILENQGLSWGEDETTEVNDFNVINHILIGEVSHRQDRFVLIRDNDLKFSLDKVESTFVPIQGDWLELNCKIQWDENKPCDISSAQVLEVLSIKPLRSKVRHAVITEWFGNEGVADRLIYFNKDSIQNSLQPQVGSKVIAEVIESNQGSCTWRAIKLVITTGSVTSASDPKIPTISDEEKKSLISEKEHKVDITHPIKFESINIDTTAEVKITIVNNSDDIQFINKWVILSKKRDSQINIQPFLTKPYKLYPKAVFVLTVTCHPKFLGNTKECFVIIFKGFQAKRFIDINVVEDTIALQRNFTKCNYLNRSENDKMKSLRNMKMRGQQPLVPGQKPHRTPNFIYMRLGSFPIPEKVWNAVLGDSEQAALSPDYYKIVQRIEDSFPCLSQEININNYIDKWHTLLYMEEIQSQLNMRKYDMTKVYLLHCQEYLGLEIEGLAEQRPSLIKGDRAVVKLSYDSTSPAYEGYIHVIKGDLVLMKFNQCFHESYTGSDVSIEFHNSRTMYRRCHAAINLSLSKLGPDVLFPQRISVQNSQISLEKLDSIQWINESLNVGQKAAIYNILAGTCRPIPYCIFGPPGTGKTITLIETILQILKLLPDSRVLIATPSNSAANLVTQRLLQHRNIFSDSIIRLIGHYLIESDNIPDIIKPFCATMDISKEFTSKSKQVVKNGINLQCQTSYIGRHRVTIGTCCCLGTLAQMGLPRGHFTHVIIDEAGQATEPEVMIPLTFIDKENGHIILAGDPKQLGPVVQSKFCDDFGMRESYLSRILSTFPFQKDYAAFTNGYDERVITKLTDNYRSVDEVISLPSEMFYDASLQAKFDRTQPWVAYMTEVVNDVFHNENKAKGGIFVYGIKGCNKRCNENPSWYNPQEASMVALVTCKLYKKNITVDEIGIIVPYVAQVRYLKLVFEAMGLSLPKIGTVEDFQGQERPIILISTVRSQEYDLAEDQRHRLGFIKNPKRLNVALTRAQVAVLLFCDPHLLSQDSLWQKVISHAVKEDHYMGCDLPRIISNK